MTRKLAEYLENLSPAARAAATSHSLVSFENRAQPAKLAGARFEVKNAADDVAELYLYGDIAWYDITAQLVADTLNGLSAKTLQVHVNSGGGDVFDGVAIFNLLRNYAKKNGASIEIYVDALAASIASVIAMAGDKVLIAKNAMMMIHRASGGCWGTADDMTSTAQILVSIENDMIIPSYVSRTKMKAADLMTMMQQSTWMNAATCVEKGFADALQEENGVAALLRPGIYDNVPGPLRNATSDWVSAAARDLPMDLEADWDGAAATERMLEAAGFNGSEPDPSKAKLGFLLYDAAEPKLKGSYKFPFADIKNGKLTALKSGWIAAKQRLADDTALPAEVKTQMEAVIAEYESRAGKGASNSADWQRMRTRLAALNLDV